MAYRQLKEMDHVRITKGEFAGYNALVIDAGLLESRVQIMRAMVCRDVNNYHLLIRDEPSCFITDGRYDEIAAAKDKWASYSRDQQPLWDEEEGELDPEEFDDEGRPWYDYDQEDTINLYRKVKELEAQVAELTKQPVW